MKLALDCIFKPCSVHFSLFYIFWHRVKIETNKSSNKKNGTKWMHQKGLGTQKYKGKGEKKPKEYRSKKNKNDN